MLGFKNTWIISCQLFTCYHNLIINLLKSTLFGYESKEQRFGLRTAF